MSNNSVQPSRNPLGIEFIRIFDIVNASIPVSFFFSSLVFLPPLLLSWPMRLTLSRYLFFTYGKELRKKSKFATSRI